jgi:2-methylisocitrate lyase-like PEP mutase family enzyme
LEDMGKLSDLFTQVRKARSRAGIGFVGGKNASTIKPRAAALLVELGSTNSENAKAAIKAGADGLIFAWDGQSSTDSLQKAVEAAQAAGENVISGLHITGGWNELVRKSFEDFKELGLNFIILPLDAPARLLAWQIKDFELIVSVPMREGDLYPTFIRNLSAFENLGAVHLDFGLSKEVSGMSIEDVLHYRAVREALRTPALVNIKGMPDEDDAYTLLTLGIQAVVLAESKDTTTTGQQIEALRDLLEKVHQEDKDSSNLGLFNKA